jgi:glutamate-1-semialdehyde 2,1-aminomutase
MVLKTLFLQEMTRHGILIKIIAPSFSHRESEINQTIEAFEKALNVIQHAIESKKVRKFVNRKAHKTSL